MSSFLHDVRQTLAPCHGDRDGPLPPLLVGLTVVTGLVDAFSYLVLGHVFVANMTGNVVFVGFALAGAPGFSLGASLAALAAFIVGALTGGRIAQRLSAHRGRLLGTSTSAEAVLVGVAAVVGMTIGPSVSTGPRYVLIVVLAIAMGLQNAVVRQLAVPDLTTTVLTMTMTGIAADGALAGGPDAKAGRRVVAITSMFLGALAGAECVLHLRLGVPLLVAFGVLAAVCSVTVVLSRHAPAWAGA